MKRKKTKRRLQVVPVWTYVQVRKAFPYLASLMRGIRENRIEAQRQHLKSQRLESKTRPDRNTLIAWQDSLRDYRQAEERYREDVQELNDLGIYCLDPIQGEALVPFARGKQLAWFVYSLFEEDPIRFWRYHTDGLEIRRPLSEAEDTSAESNVA